MIHYHGGPVTPVDAALALWTGRNGLISFMYPEQTSLLAEVCRTFVIDNGAFSVWKKGGSVNWLAYYHFVEKWRKHPACNWALIPDVIDGTEQDNDKLLSQWPHDIFGVPVWHLHESITRLQRLCATWPRVALGSSGEWSRPGTRLWWQRMGVVLDAICDETGRPPAKLHGLRMMNPAIVEHVPLSFADSSSVARNIGIDTNWSGQWSPKSKRTRAVILADRYEAVQSPAVWKGLPDKWKAA